MQFAIFKNKNYNDKFNNSYNSKFGKSNAKIENGMFLNYKIINFMIKFNEQKLQQKRKNKINSQSKRQYQNFEAIEDEILLLQINEVKQRFEYIYHFFKLLLQLLIYQYFIKLIQAKMDLEKQQVDQINVDFEIERQSSKTHKNLVISQYFNEYILLLGGYSQTTKNQVYQDQNFKEHNICYDQNQKKAYPQLSVTVFKESIHSQALLLSAKWGAFSMIISILNVEEESTMHYNEIAKGGYGKIYHHHSQSESFILKCILYKHFKNTIAAKFMAIKEVFLLKIASALRIGPKLKKWAGFDLINRRDCIQFVMEKCYEIEQMNNTIKKTLFADLKILHSLNIIHFDIKPQNLMFSQTYQKMVFIDFGLSQIIQSQMGVKSYINFRGTLDYCSPQMFKVFASGEKHLIDLYFNDAHCLQKSVNILYKINSQNIKNVGKQYQLSFHQGMQNICVDQILNVKKGQNPQLILFLVKYLCFMDQIKILQEIFRINSQLIHNCLIDKVIMFLLQIQPSGSLQQFYQLWINGQKTKSIQFFEVDKIYNSKTINLKILTVDNQRKQLIRQFYIDLLVLSEKEKQQFCTLSKHHVKQILTNFNVTGQNRQLFIKMYLKYISFTNNIFASNMKDRVEITRLIFKNLVYSQYIYQNEIINDLAFLKRVIKLLFVIQIEQALTQNHVQQKSAINQLKKENTNALLQNIFLLKIVTKDELMKWVQKIFNQPNLAYFDKLQLLLRIRQNSYWYLYRTNKTNNHKYGQTNIQVFWIIQKWCIQKCQYIQTQKHQYSWVASFLKNILINGTSEKLTDAQKIQLKQIPQQLYCMLQIQFLINNSTAQNFIQKKIDINKVYQFVKNQEKLKLFPWYFRIFQNYFNNSQDHNKKQQIIKIAKKNIKCEQLFNQFIIKYCQKKCKASVQGQSSSSYKLQHFFLCIVLYNQLFAQQTRLFLQLLFADKNVNVFDQFIAQPNRSFRQILIRVQQMIGYCSQNKLGEQFSDENHYKCIQYCSLLNLLSSVHNILSLHEVKFDFDCYYDKMQVKTDIIQCQKCKLLTRNLYIAQILKFSIETIHNSHTKEILVNKCYELLTKVPQTNIINQNAFMKLAKINLFYFCLYNPNFEGEYKGITSYFLFLKQKQYLEYLIYILNKNSEHFQTLMKVLFDNLTPKDFSYFLTYLAKYLSQKDSICTFQLIYNSYVYFLQKQNKSIDIKAFLDCLESSQQSLKNGRTQINIFSFMYKFECIRYIQSKYYNYIILKTLHCFQVIPNWAKLFFQTNIYRMILMWNHMKIKVLKIRKFNFVKKLFIKMIFKAQKQLLKSNIKALKNKQPINANFKNKLSVYKGKHSIKEIDLNVQITFKVKFKLT